MSAPTIVGAGPEGSIYVSWPGHAAELRRLNGVYNAKRRAWLLPLNVTTRGALRLSQADSEAPSDDGPGGQFRAIFAAAEDGELVRLWRRLARIHHPDRGGRPDAFRALVDAYAERRRSMKVNEMLCSPDH